MKKVRNLQFLPSGFIQCETLIGETWKIHTMKDGSEYEIHEDSEWQDIKPCDQAEKDAYLAQQEQEVLMVELASLDLPTYTIERALAGDQHAIQLINENEQKKALIRAKLK